MDSFKKRSKTSRFFIGRFISFILLIILVLLGNATYRMYQKYKESVARRENIAEEYAELESRINTIKTRVASLETTEGREAEIRRSFNVVKPGEKVAIVIPGEESEEKVEEKTPWYYWLWRGNFNGKVKY